MIAQCSTCGRQFTTDSWGEQSCPHCGTRVVLQRPPDEGASRPETPGRAPAPAAPAEGEHGPGEPPEGAPSRAGEAEGAVSDAGPVSRAPAGVPPLSGAEGPVPGSPPPPTGGYEAGGPGAGGPGGPGGPGVLAEPVPWERRSELGAVKALFLTLKESVLQPSTFFPRVRTETSDGAFLYGWIVYTVGSLVGGFWSWLQFRVQAGMDPQVQEMFGPLAQALAHPAYLLLAPVTAAIYLLVWAALVHLGLLVLSANNRGWNATFKAVAYSVGPTLLAVVPFCGATVGGIWALVLTIFAVRYTQRTTPGKAVVAVLWPVLLGMCCAVAAALFGGLAAAAAVGAAGG